MQFHEAMAFLAEHRVAHLATIGADGRPHVVPICFVIAHGHIFTALDQKPKRTVGHRLKRVRNILANPQAAVLGDDYSEDWRRLAWVMVRGPAELLTDGPQRELALQLLRHKYAQYREMELGAVISIKAEEVTGWSWRSGPTSTLGLTGDEP